MADRPITARDLQVLEDSLGRRMSQKVKKVPAADWVKIVGLGIAITGATWGIGVGLLKAEFVQLPKYEEHVERNIAHEKEAAEFASGTVTVLKEIRDDIREMKEEIKEQGRRRRR